MDRYEQKQAEKSHVVIVGCGFAGIAAAHVLGRAHVHVTIIDRSNHHTFQPLLYQVATAGLAPADIAHPIRAILNRYENTEVILGDVIGIDLTHRHVQTRTDLINFDYLVVASGASHSYFGHDEWSTIAPGLKTIEDATEIRRRVLLAYELAEQCQDPLRRQAYMTFVVIGGGPTGVEMAGAIAELGHQTMAGDFRHINPSDSKIILIEAGPQILTSFSAPLPQKAFAQLQALGVEVLLNTRVTEVTRDHVVAGTRRIDTATTVWAAGVVGSPLGKLLGAPLDRAGRVIVAKDLTVPSHPNVYVVGDLAASTQDNGKPVPGVAPAATQQGRHAARNILRQLKGEDRRPFHYVDKGSMATIGRAAAVAEIGRLKLSGLPAWLLWVFIHIYFLISFRNRVMVLLEWIWAYFTFARSSRLIVTKDHY